MRRDLEHLPAWNIDDAARRTLAPGIFREYKRAQKAMDEFRPSSPLTYAVPGLNGGIRYVDPRHDRVLERRDTATRNRDKGMINHFALGKLVTYGREEKLSAELKLIPPSAWRDMRITDWKEFRAATRRPKVVFRDIRIYPVLEAPNAIDHLTGMSLMAAISDLIFGDPLIDTLRCCSRGKSLELDKRRSDSHFLWPLVQPIANWRRGLSTASRLANSILGLRVAQLARYLSTAQVMAVETAHGVVEVVPPARWTEVGVYLDLNSGATYKLPAGTDIANINAIKPFWTDLILSRPDQIPLAFHVKPMVHDDVRATTSKTRTAPRRKAADMAEQRASRKESCRIWLEKVMSTSPDERTQSKESLLKQARRKWGKLSKRSFESARILADNRIALNAGWDMEMLKLELTELSLLGADLSALGFNERELATALNGAGAGLTDEDAIPDVAERAVSCPGDIWCLGPHRVACGDSTDAELAGALLSGASPQLMVTDPPYGVEYDPEWRHRLGVNKSDKRGKIRNDERADWTAAWALFPGDIAYVWHGALHAGTVADSLIKTGAVSYSTLQNELTSERGLAN